MKKYILISFLFLFMAGLGQAKGPYFPTELIGGTPAKISLYPNPATDLVYLKIETEGEKDFQVKVVNLIGQTLFEEKVQAHQRQRIDLRSFPPGVYFVQIEEGEHKIMKRLVIQ